MSLPTQAKYDVHLEHLFFADAPDLGDGYREPRGLLGPLVLDLRAECFGSGWVGTIEQVGRDGVGGLLFGRATLDITFLVLLDSLAHLNLLGMTLFRVQLRPQATQILRIFAVLVALTSFFFARPLLVV